MCRGTGKASVHSDSVSVIMQQGYQKPQVFFTFSGVETEIELILARSGILVNDLLHRSSLGIGWRRASGLCSVPQDVSGHKKESKEVPAAERGITLQDSIQILELTKNLVPVGSGKPLQ